MIGWPAATGGPGLLAPDRSENSQLLSFYLGLGGDLAQLTFIFRTFDPQQDFSWTLLDRTYDRLFNIRRLSAAEAARLFVERLHFAFEEIVETDRFDEPIDIFVHCLKELTITEETLYQAVHADLDTLLQMYPTHPDQPKLRRNLALFEQEYYLQKVDCATLTEALVGLETWIP